MKRYGHLMEQMMTEENFICAEKRLGVHKSDNRMAQYISTHAEQYGHKLFVKVQNGLFQWHRPREAIIRDTYKGKERHLKIPCLEDQAAQLAWLNIAETYIMRKNYPYNCGSIPGAGQTRAVKALQKWLRDPRMKYGATSDIRKFYDTCPHGAVRKGLERIFKDKAFVDYAMGFVGSMSDTGVGIAIGYPVSHWLANVALMELDYELRRRFPDVRLARYMDDMALVSSNKRHIRKALYFLKEGVEGLGMKLKRWGWFRVKGRGLTFLSYRFFNGFTLLTKKLMIRIARRMKKAPKRMSAHVAAGVVSYDGILQHCNSFHFRQAHVYPYVNMRTCRKLVGMHMMKWMQQALCHVQVMLNTQWEAMPA